jgi:uncharacterized membrane protein YfcA
MGLTLAAFAFGTCIGALGTLVGVGGGFIIVPVVAFIAPGWSTRTITAYSLAVVFANASSGTLAYLRQRRVDTRSVLPFALAAAPGVLLGLVGSDRLPRGVFDPLFGALLLAMSAILAFQPERRFGRDGPARRDLTARDGERYRWTFSMPLALAGCFLVGVTSSLFGIGGGPIQVPMLISLLNYPEHVATATSHAVLALTSLLATIAHALQGDYRTDWLPTLATAVGALVGAPFGARASRHVPGRVLVRILAGMLAFIAARMLLPHGAATSEERS